MSRFVLSQLAKSDLDDIWSYIASDNTEAADTVVRSILQKIILLGAHREIGRARDELQPGLRSFPVANYIIFYRLAKDQIEIARILHSARDFPSLFE